MPAERPNTKYSMPGRLKPLSERTGWLNSIPQAQEQPTVTLTSWKTVSGIFELTTQNNKVSRRIYRRNRKLIKKFYDAWFDVAAGKGNGRLDELTYKYTDESSKLYNPKRMDALKPFIQVIRDSFPQNRSRR